MADKVSVTPIKRAILGTPVGGSVQVSPRYAKILKKMKLVAIDGEQTAAPKGAAPTGNPLSGVEFASDVAAELAIAHGLTPRDLGVVQPGARGYTKSQVAEAVQAKGGYRTRALTAE